MTSKEYLSWIQTNEPVMENATKWGVKALSQSGIDMSLFLLADDDQIVEAIMNTGVSSINEVSSLVSIVRRYMRINGVSKVFNVSPKIIFNKIQISGTGIIKKKFIDFNSYNSLVSRVKNTSVFDAEKGVDNGIWYAALLEAIWCGIYSEKLDALYNLRAADIHGGFVAVHPNDAPSYDVYISGEVSSDLIGASKVRSWYRKPFIVPITGEFDDSVFKLERRNGNNNNYKFTYTSKLKHISDEYLEYSLNAKKLYISGLVYRIVTRLMDQDSTRFHNFSECLDFVFGITSNTIRLKSYVKDIINDELAKSGYKSSLYVLRKFISGNLNDFVPDPLEKPAWLK